MIATRVRPTVDGIRPRDWWRRRHEPVDASLLAFLRIGFGGVLAWELWRYVEHDRPRRYYGETKFHFTYWPFDWVRPLPDPWLMYLFVALALCAALVAIGVYFRTACAVLSAGLAYIFLLDRTYYLNHWYLSVLLTFLLALTPADRVWAVDARRRAVTLPTSDERSASTVPRWSVQILRFQLGLVYLVGGLAKLQWDWLKGRPLEIWIGGDTDVPVIGPLLEHRSTIVVMAILATVFDLCVVPLMLDRRTRRFAYPVALGFHLLNSRLFSIGMFPWMMMLATVVFFPHDFPRRMVADLRVGRHRWATGIGAVVMGGLSTWVPDDPFPVITLVGTVAGAIAAYAIVAPDPAEATMPVSDPQADVAAGPARFGPILKWVLGGYVAIQILLPIRPYIYPNNPSWSEEGHMFAWRMLLRTKSGTVTFTVTDTATGRSWTVDPYSDLTQDQVDTMADQPEMIVQYAQWIEPRERQNAVGDVRITATAMVSLNGHEERILIDPNRDLTTIDRPWWPAAPWISDAPSG